MSYEIKVNGVDQTVDVDGDTPLLWVLRDVLGMTGTKFGCDIALGGACTVHVDGVATRSCITAIDSIGNSEITTIEAIGATATGAKIQKAWLDREVVQCGYCQSGQIMSASALIANNPHPTDADIDDAMSGNICRCGGSLAQDTGDVDSAIASGVTKVEATYQVPFLAHATMEPMNCTVHVRKDGCEIWIGSQVIARAQAAAAKTAGLPLDKVVVHNH
jgi:isoquinoline 1-oxidoreductase alpha subunit